jgi:anti-sigma regulatory factor (Ser/Thr protein kinase)
MSGSALRRAFVVLGKDYTNGGRASTAIKDVLKQLGVSSEVVRRVAIASYEAEMNVVMYARRGVMTLVVTPQEVTVTSDDEGPGIADIALAMQEGWSTATPEMREMGFGAGMGLPNMQRHSDELVVTSEVGRGTRVSIRVGLDGRT